MFESFAVGALSCLVISGFYFLFKKPCKRSHVYIQNTILVILSVLGVIAFVSSLATIDEFPALILPVLTVVMPGEFFIFKKLLKNFNLLNNDKFE